MTEFVAVEAPMPPWRPTAAPMWHVPPGPHVRSPLDKTRCASTKSHSSIARRSQDAGIVQDIKFGVRLVAGATKNSTLGHNNPRRVTGEPVEPEHGEEEEADGPKGDAARAVAIATKGTRSLQPIHLEVSRASAGAVDAVEAQGGTVTCAHFNRLALRALVRGVRGFLGEGGSALLLRAMEREVFGLGLSACRSYSPPRGGGVGCGIPGAAMLRSRRFCRKSRLLQGPGT